MKNRKSGNGNKGMGVKPLALLLALALLLGGVMGGTLAWLTDKTDTVTNTFTVGNIEIELWENDFVLSTNTLDTTKKVTAENEYKVVPGGTSPKNPTVTVKAGSEACYVYVTVENNLLLNDGTAVAELTFAEGWTVVATSGTKTLYRYNNVVNLVNASADQDIPVFTHVSYDAEAILKDNIAQLDGDTIVVNAFAHQSANIGDVSVADNAAKTHFSFPVTP